MSRPTKKAVEIYTKAEIKRLCKIIEKKAINNIHRAINCGALDEKSEFITELNSLLALALIVVQS